MESVINNISGTEKEVCNDIAKRQIFGIAKYGRTVAGNPLTDRQWLQHGYEEALDLAIYLKRLMQEMDSKYSAKNEQKPD